MRWKWVLSIAVTLIMGAVIAGYISLARFDYNRFKPDLIELVKWATGRELILTGDIRPKLTFKPTLYVEGIALRNADWGTRLDMLTVKRLEIRLALAPLLFLQVRVKRLLLVEPDILIEIDPSGRSNLEFDTAATSDSPGVPPVAMPRIKFDSVIIRDGVFTYRDAPAQDLYTGRIDHLRAAIPGLDRPVALDADLQFLNRSFSLSGHVGALPDLLDSKRPWPLDFTGKTSGITFTVKGHIRDIAGFQDYRLNISAHGKSSAEFERVLGIYGIPRLSPLSVTFWFSDPGPGRLRFDDFTAQSGKQRMSGAMELHIRRARPYVAANFLLKNVDLRPILSSGPPKSGENAKERPLRVVLADSISPKALGWIDADMAIEGRKLRLPGAFVDHVKGVTRIDKGRLKATADSMRMRYAKGVVSGSFTFDYGRKRPRLSAVLSAKNMDLRTLMKDSTPTKSKVAGGRISVQKELTKIISPQQFGFLDADITLDARHLVIPKVSIENISMSAHLRNKRLKAIAKSIQFRHRKDVVSGSMTLTVAMGKRPHLVAKLATDRFDMRPLLPKRAAPFSQRGGANKKVFSSKLISFDILREIEAELDLNADQLLLYRFAFDNFNLKASLKKERLHVKPVSFKIGRGNGGGSLFIRDKGKRGAYIELNLRSRRINIASMMAKLGLEAPVNGRVDSEFRIKTSGRSIAEMMGSMNGSILVVMGRGKLYYKHLGLLGGELSSALFRWMNAAKKKNYTEVNCGLCEFHILNGMARSDWMIIDNPQTTIAGRGKINLKTEQIDFVFDPNPKHGFGIKGVGKISLSLGELANPVKLGGTLAEPYLVINPGGTVITISKAVGGFFIAGPFGLAAALTDFSTAGDNPCLSAMHSMKKKAAKAARKKPSKRNTRGLKSDP